VVAISPLGLRLAARFPSGRRFPRASEGVSALVTEQVTTLPTQILIEVERCQYVWRPASCRLACVAMSFKIRKLGKEERRDAKICKLRHV
jgi:hypothetical protein